MKSDVGFEIQLTGVREFEDYAERLRGVIRKNLKQMMRIIMMRLQREAKRRVPVSGGKLQGGVGGFLRNSINVNLISQTDGIEGEIGSHAKYAVFIEFGTRYIAGGAVEALGTNPDITDAEAIKTWPALEERGGSGQQMPWLRPAVVSQEEWIQQKLTEALDF